jgi:uncharacterized membrane protein (UPF0127 family)
MTRRVFLIAGFLLASLITTGCNQPQGSGLPTVKMKLGSQTFTLEIANTAETRERGLMRRDSMPADHGMIFVFKETSKMAFWMKNTRIPLDVVYIAEDGRVDSVKQMQPYVETAVWSDGPLKWAVELNQGEAEKAGVKKGDLLVIPDGVKETKE